LKEYRIQEKEKEIKKKEEEVLKQLHTLDQDIARCKLIVDSGNKEEADYKMCEFQANDYQIKKAHLEALKKQYAEEMAKFTHQKETFYSKPSSFIQLSIDLTQQQNTL